MCTFSKESFSTDWERLRFRDTGKNISQVSLVEENCLWLSGKILTDSLFLNCGSLPLRAFCPFDFTTAHGDHAMFIVFLVKVS